MQGFILEWSIFYILVLQVIALSTFSTPAQIPVFCGTYCCASGVSLTSVVKCDVNANILNKQKIKKSFAFQDLIY